MGPDTDFLTTVRKRLSPLHRRVHRTIWPSEGTDDETDAPGGTAWEPGTVELDRVPELLASRDREAIGRAVGWLSTIPSVSEPMAVDALSICLELTEHPEFPIKRLAYRGISALFEHHPDIVEPHVASVSTGLADRFVVVQEASSALLVDLLRHAPHRTAAVYPYLQSENQKTRELALEVLIEVGRTSPEVLAAIDPFLQDELADPSVSRELIIDLVLTCDRREGRVLAVAIPTLIGWLPTTDRAVEEGIVRAVTAWDDLPVAGSERVVRSFLTYLASGDRPHRAAASRWLVTAVLADEGLRTAIESWREDTDEWERLRVAAAIDEATERGVEVVGPYLFHPDDAFAGEFDLVDESS